MGYNSVPDIMGLSSFL